MISVRLKTLRTFCEILVSDGTMNQITALHSDDEGSRLLKKVYKHLLKSVLSYLEDQHPYLQNSSNLVYTAQGLRKRIYSRLGYACIVVSKLLGALEKLRKLLLVLSCLSIRPSVWNYSTVTDRIFMKFDIPSIFRESVEKIQVSFKSERNKVYFI